MKVPVPAFILSSFFAGLIPFTLAQAAEKPNILHIVADDLGWKDVGFNGATDLKPPNIDALAAGGAHSDAGVLDWFRNNKPVKENGYTTRLIGSDPVNYINQQSADKPFYLYLTFNAPHTPFQAPQNGAGKITGTAARRRQPKES